MPSFGSGEAFTVLIAAVVALGPLVTWIALIVWARRVGRRFPERSPWRRIWLVPVASFGAQLLGVGATVLMLLSSFSTVAHVPAADRSSALADGISNAMNGTACGIAGSVLLLFASVVLIVVGSQRAPATAPSATG